MHLDFFKNKRLVSSIIISALFLFIVYTSLPYLSAFFGAIILTFIFHPLDKRLRKYFSAKISAGIILVIALIIIILPLIFIINGLINQITNLPYQIETLRIIKQTINEKFPFTLELNEGQIINEIMPILRAYIKPVFSNIIFSFAILFLLFFLTYYLILYYEKIKKIIIENLPFNRRNNLIIIDKFKEITYATIIGTFLIAIIQGGLLALNFWLLGIPNALFWGALTTILSFIPMIGSPVIWIPAAIIQILLGKLNIGIALIIVGILISLIDNILRPIINQRYGSIHPLVSVIGIFIGISKFGIVGIFIGPIIIAYFILFLKLYIEEYFDKENEIKKAII
ncbi:MAG: AI-2E family transporter [Nanoarchaeota archaeon]